MVLMLAIGQSIFEQWNQSFSRGSDSSQGLATPFCTTPCRNAGHCVDDISLALIQWEGRSDR